MALAATVIKVFPKRTEETPPCRQQRLRPLHPAFAQFPSTGCCLAFVCNGNVMAYRIRGNNLWMEIVQRRNLLKWESQPPLPVQRTCRMPYGQEAFDFCPSSQARLRVPIGPRRLSWAAQGTAHFFFDGVLMCWKYRMLTVTVWYSIGPAFGNLEDVFWPDVGLPPLFLLVPKQTSTGYKCVFLLHLLGKKVASGLPRKRAPPYPCVS